MSDDPGLCGFMTGVVDSIFVEAAEGDFRAPMTALEGVAGVAVPGGITNGDLGRLPYATARSLKRG